MDLSSFRALLTSAGQEALATAVALQPVEADFLRHFSGLSRRFPPELARAALETAILRREAQAKFTGAQKMYFTRQALEQATSHEVAAYRAARYTGMERIYDMGCSIGGDSLALAQHAPVTGLDLDPLRLSIAQANAAALGLAEQATFLQADLAAPLPLALSSNVGLFFDPARRAGAKRIFSVRDYQPPLGTLRGWLASTPALGVKISPGVDLDELASYDAGIEFISLRGELKEAVLWFGPLRPSASRRATLLPGPHILEGDPRLEPAARFSPPQAYLYEPDPAVLRAGLVRHIGERLDAAQLDPDIAYLTAPNRVETPFARVWAVEDWLPFSLKRLRAVLRERQVGRVTVKKRGSPLEPEQLIRDLRLKPGEAQEERVLFLTHLQGEPVVILCYPAA